MNSNSEAQNMRVIGIDVGTTSARAGVFDLDGNMLGHSSHPIDIHEPRPEFYEQSSENIWEACCRSVKEALQAGNVQAEQVVGLSFDGTSSVAAFDAQDQPVSISPTGDDRWNIILWMDHRALEETELINSTGHEVLKYVGGKISPEMVTPKLLWVKKNLKQAWERGTRFLDLTDFLTYRSTGIDVRSMCTTVCKWTYLGHKNEGKGEWAQDFFQSIGLEDLLEGDRSGRRIEAMGTRIGGLTAKSAQELGLVKGTPVGVGVIDAHAGALGLLGGALHGKEDPQIELERALALIGGTSSCHLAVSREPLFLDGIWGPYYSALIPGMWLTEGGQTTSGSLIDHMIEDSQAAVELKQEAKAQGKTIYELLNEQLLELGNGQFDPELTRELHILPYFLGNRSPRANPDLKGVISGVTLDRSRQAVALKYLAAIQAVAYGTRHIIESMNAGGYQIDQVLVCGGGTKNPAWLQEHADITGCQLHLPREPEAVLLGTAILGAVAAGVFETVPQAMKKMGQSEQIIEPNPQNKNYHDKKYQAFHKLYDHFVELNSLLSEGSK